MNFHFPEGYTRPCRGGVLARRPGKFYGDGEVFNPETGKLPTFLPRTEWPADSSEGIDQRPDGLYMNQDWSLDDGNVTDDQRSARALVARGYPQLQPMPPYTAAISPHSGLPTYNGSIWPDHVGILHGLLTHTLEEQTGVWNEEIAELMTCVSYGMDDSVTFLKPWVFRIPEDADLDDYVWLSQLGMPMPRSKDHCDLPPADRAAYQQTMRTRMLGRRWVVVLVSQRGVRSRREGHTMATIFDRKKGQLYIFDSVDVGRERRVAACVYLWTQFWDRLDMAFDFQYFVPPVSIQPYNWECGLLSVHFILKTLRCRENDPVIEAWDSNVDIGDYNLFGRCLAELSPLEDPSLELSDWLPTGFIVPQAGLNEIVRLFRVMICNELGLKEHEDFNWEDWFSCKTFSPLPPPGDYGWSIEFDLTPDEADFARGFWRLLEEVGDDPLEPC